MSAYIRDYNRTGNLASMLEYAANYDNPTLDDFEEAHIKWRKLLDEKDEVIKHLEAGYRSLKQEIKRLSARPIDLDDDITNLKRVAEQLKEDKDKLLMILQDRDIEIAELKEQVTLQTSRWLVPNFK